MEAITSTLKKLHVIKDGESYVHPTEDQVKEVREKYASKGQEHVFTFWDSLSEDEQAELYHQLVLIDPDRVAKIAESVLSPKESDSTGELAPLPDERCASTLDASRETLDNWRRAGLEAIAEGKVGLLLMAGGQGTRLGSSAPKGCYDIGLPSKKSLFQLQAERLLKLQQLAARASGDATKKVVIPWYIMTSGPTRKPTEEFLKEHKYFGLNVIPLDALLIHRKKTLSFSNKAFFPA
jgi:UDP-N-acetylglucosamine/UDP-N-acetylgalactosamine diphosphorylase